MPICLQALALMMGTCLAFRAMVMCCTFILCRCLCFDVWKFKQGSEKPGFLKKSPTHWVWGFIERAVGKLFGWFSSSAKLSIIFDSTLDYLQIRKFITYWSLEAVNIKKSLTITGITNWNWIKFAVGFLTGFTPKNPLGFFYITQVSKPWI